MLELFFSEEMIPIRDALRPVEWSIDVENDSRKILSIDGLGNEHGDIELSGAMSIAYGTGSCQYSVQNTYNVKIYSFEFNGLISSYPASENEWWGGNRESITIGLAHSVLLAKYLGAEKLKGIR